MSIEFTSKGKKKQIPCFELNLFGKKSKWPPGLYYYIHTDQDTNKIQTICYQLIIS
jgi:hypothetical protein